MSKKSRKLIRSGAPASAPAPIPAEDPTPDALAAAADRAWNFTFLPDTPPEVVDEPALHALMKQWRHGRATRSIGQAFSDAYFTLFAVVLFGAMAVNAIVGTQARAVVCDTTACLTGRTLIPWALHFALCALALSVARLFGPVLASAAEGFWLMEAPLSRARMLRGRLWGVLATSFAVSAALAAVIAALSGVDAGGIVVWGLATGLSASGLMAWAAAGQAGERTRALRVVQSACGALAVAALAAMLAITAGWWTTTVLGSLALLPWGFAGVGLAATIGFGIVAHRRLERIRRARLTSGGALVSGMQGAMFALDLGLARDILVEREAVDRGHVRPVRGRGVGVRALVWRDAQRLLRSPKPLVGVVAAAFVPYATDAVGLGVVTPLVGALALMTALIPTLGTLRVLSRTGGLARAMPFSTATIRTATTVVPAVLAALWSLAVVAAMSGLTGGIPRTASDAALVALATALAGLLGAVRWQTSKPVDFAVPMVATEMGALPTTLVFNLLRGFDVVALTLAPILLGASPLIALAIGAVVALLTRSGFDLSSMAEEAKEQQRIADAEKARAVAKKVVPRPSR